MNKGFLSSLYLINATAIFCLIGLMPLFGGRVIDSLAILLALNLTVSREIINNLRRNFIVCALLIQYPVINLINVSLREANEFNYMHSPANFEMWAWSCAAIILSSAFFSPKISKKFIQYGIPVSALITFGVIANIWFSIGGRIEPFGYPVFYAPLFGTSLALLFIFRSSDALRRPGVMEIALIVFSMIISIVFSQTRGIFVAQVVVLFSATLITIVQQHWRWAVTITGAGLTSIILLMATLLWTDNGNLVRLKSAVYSAQILLDIDVSAATQNLREPYATVDRNNSGSLNETAEVNGILARDTNHNDFVAHLKNGAERLDTSSGTRLTLWAMSIEKIIERPLIGYGANHEPKFINELGLSFKHVHNILLSWMLWGGPITVLSGLVFIFAAPLSAMITGAGMSHKLSTLSISMLWLVAMAFDSFIVYGAFNYIFITLSALSFAGHSRE